MKKILTLLVCVVISSGAVMAQNQHFTTSGTIEYEKSVNMYALIKKLMGDNDDSFMQQMYDSYKRDKPQFKKMKSTLIFSGDKSLYTPVEDDNQSDAFWFSMPMANQINTVYIDLNQGRDIVKKQVFEQTYLVSDTTRKIHWKITDETREIAGYTCRRANAIVMDSIYVVAFYTDKIHVSGGPENFTGLPGMILGLAIPHENVTWFATKVTDMVVDEKSITPPKKGKPVNQTELKTTLQGVMKDWGKYAGQSLKAFLL